jgi:CYTH domain-containing protein
MPMPDATHVVSRHWTGVIGGTAGRHHVAVQDRRPGEGRYARVEREQRWLVGRFPPGTRRAAKVTDRYLTGTRLRLRRVEDVEGVTLKLGQKVRVVPSDPEVVKLTSLYLSVEEYRALAALPAAELRKTRSYLVTQGDVVAIDRFHGRLDGLVLAEAELEESEDRLPMPSFAVRDVTKDDRFSGSTDDAVNAVLAEARAPR